MQRMNQLSLKSNFSANEIYTRFVTSRFTVIMHHTCHDVFVIKNTTHPDSSQYLSKFVGKNTNFRNDAGQSLERKEGREKKSLSLSPRRRTVGGNAGAKGLNALWVFNEFPGSIANNTFHERKGTAGVLARLVTRWFARDNKHRKQGGKMPAGKKNFLLWTRIKVYLVANERAISEEGRRRRRRKVKAWSSTRSWKLGGAHISQTLPISARNNYRETR